MMLLLFRYMKAALPALFRAEQDKSPEDIFRVGMFSGR